MPSPLRPGGLGCGFGTRANCSDNRDSLERARGRVIPHFGGVHGPTAPRGSARDHSQHGGCGAAIALPGAPLLTGETKKDPKHANALRITRTPEKAAAFCTKSRNEAWHSMAIM